MGNPPVGPIGGMMPPQPGIPPQQQGMRPPMPPHGNYTSLYFLIFKGFVCCLFFISEMSSTVKNSFSRMQLCSLKKKMNSLHLKCFVYRSVWCSSPGHARLSSWSNASLWSGTSDGAPVPKWTSSTSNGNETSCHVARWPLLMLLHTL